MEALLGAVGLAWLVLFALAVLWMILPFAIFGIKGRLDSIVEGIHQTNARLEALTSRAPAAEATLLQIEHHVKRSQPRALEAD